jgi:hypothetical protein
MVDGRTFGPRFSGDIHMYEPFLGIPAVGECPIYIAPMLLWAFIWGVCLAVPLSWSDGRLRPFRSRSTLAWFAAISVIALMSHTAFRVIPPRYPALGFLLVTAGSLLAAYVGVRVSGNWSRPKFVAASAIILIELLVVYGIGNRAVWAYDQDKVTHCEVNLKMMYHAIDKYHAERNSSYPPEKGWQDSLRPYAQGMYCSISRCRAYWVSPKVAEDWRRSGRAPLFTYIYHAPTAHCADNFAMVTCDHPAGQVLPAQRIILQANGTIRRDPLEQ